MNYARAEMETSIVWDDEEKVAHIYTSSPVSMRKLDKLCDECPEYNRIWVETDKDGRVTAAKYEVISKLVRFSKPVISVMTDEQREAARERMRKLRSKT